MEQERITSFFAPPTVWISLLRHQDFATRNLTSLKNIYYGASIMPLPVLDELRERLPGAGPITPMARPRSHPARPSCARGT